MSQNPNHTSSFRCWAAEFISVKIHLFAPSSVRQRLVKLRVWGSQNLWLVIMYSDDFVNI